MIAPNILCYTTEKLDLRLRYSLREFGIGLDIRSNDSDIISELRDELYPYAPLPEVNQDSGGCESNFSFSITKSEAVFRRISDVAHTLIATWIVSRCRTEEGTIRFVEYACSDDARLFHHQLSNCFIVQRNCSLDFIYSESNNAISGVQDVVSHAVEHVITKLAIRNGALLLHASAVVENGEATLFVGQKRSGKTTCFFDGCIAHDATPLSVDKVYLYRSSSGEIRVASHPSRLRALAGTLSKYSPNFDDLIPDDFINAERSRLWKGESAGKVKVPLKRFEDYCGRRFVTAAPLGRLIFPRLSMQTTNMVNDALQPSWLREQLLSNSFSPDNPEEDWWSKLSLDRRELMVRENNDVIDKLVEYSTIEFEGSEDLSKIFSKRGENG